MAKPVVKSLSVMLMMLLSNSIDMSEGFQAFTRSSTRRMSSSLRMDVESFESSLYEQRLDFDRVMKSSDIALSNRNRILEAEGAHGMPWKKSIQQKDGKSPPLLYMPFWEWQMSFMKENLTNLQVMPCSAKDSTSYPASTEDLSYKENTKKGARMVNLCFTSNEYSKIRLTYYDAGEGVQVFNSVWYPHESNNVPVLGIDLLSFGGKKYLGIVDFQPIHDDDKDHSTPSFETDILKPIRDKYPSLHGKMSAKFYDETKFFSKQMLFARFEDGDIVEKDLLPAFQDYVSAHVDLVQNNEPDSSLMKMVKDRHAAYDSYSADRDPATGLFAAMFGKEWADEFVYGFLFSQSERPEEGAERPMGGGPPPQRQQQKQEAAQKLSMAPVVRQGVR